MRRRGWCDGCRHYSSSLFCLLDDAAVVTTERFENSHVIVMQNEFVTRRGGRFHRQPLYRSIHERRSTATRETWLRTSYYYLNRRTRREVVLHVYSGRLNPLGPPLRWCTIIIIVVVNGKRNGRYSKRKLNFTLNTIKCDFVKEIPGGTFARHQRVRWNRKFDH